MCTSLGRDIVRLCTLVSAAAGGFLLFLSLQHFNAVAPSTLELSELWFLAGLLWLGTTLLVLGLLASCAVCGDRTAPLHMVRHKKQALPDTMTALPGAWRLSLACPVTHHPCPNPTTPNRPPTCALPSLQYNGATLALLPVELGVGALWLGRSKLLRQFAALDPTLTLSSILDCLEDHRRLAATLGMAFVALQLTALLLGACLGCCGHGGRPRRKHPW